MTSVVWRATSAIVLSAMLAIVFWLVPNLGPSTFASTPDGTMWVFLGLFALFWLYLLVQGYPISHGHIGSSSAHNLDSMVSVLPAFVAVFGLAISILRFWPLSTFNMVVAGMTLLVVFFDLWVLGGAASQINRLTDEQKIIR